MDTGLTGSWETMAESLDDVFTKADKIILLTTNTNPGVSLTGDTIPPNEFHVSK